jgi:hypothetical protein
VAKLLIKDFCCRYFDKSGINFGVVAGFNPSLPVSSPAILFAVCCTLVITGGITGFAEIDFCAVAANSILSITKSIIIRFIEAVFAKNTTSAVFSICVNSKRLNTQTTFYEQAVKPYFPPYRVT